MLPMRLAVFEHLDRHLPARRAQGHRARTGRLRRRWHHRGRGRRRRPRSPPPCRCWPGPHRSSGTSRSATAARRRLDRPRRSGRGVPGRGAGARRGAGGGLDPRAPRHPGRRLLHRAVGDGAGARGSATSASASRCGPVGAGFAVQEFARRHGDFAIAGRGRRPSSSTTTTGSGAAPSGCSAWARPRRRATAAEAAIPGRPSAIVPPRRSASWRWPASTTSRRPPRLGELPAHESGPRWRRRAWQRP